MRLKELLFRRSLKQIQLVRIAARNNRKTSITSPRISGVIAGKLAFSKREISDLKKALEFLGIPKRTINAISELKS
jgi:hypothetical protein